MVYLNNWVPESNPAQRQVWNPTPGFDEELAKTRAEREERAELEMIPAVADAKDSADAASFWLTKMAKSPQESSGFLKKTLEGYVNAMDKTGEVLAATPYSGAIGAGKLGDVVTKFIGYDMLGNEAFKEGGIGFGSFEKAIDKSFDETKTGRVFKEIASKSPTATKLLSDAVVYGPANMVVGGAAAALPGIGAWGLGKLTPLLTSAKGAQFIDGIKNVAKTPFVRGMINPQNLEQATLSGFAKAGLYAGRYTGAAAENMAVSRLARPLWYDREMEERGDREYLTEYGGLAARVYGYDCLWALTSILPMRIKIGRMERAMNENAQQGQLRLAEAIRDKFANEEIGNQVLTHTFANKQTELETRLLVEREARTKFSPDSTRTKRTVNPLLSTQMEYATQQVREGFNALMGYGKEAVFDFSTPLSGSKKSLMQELYDTFLESPYPWVIMQPSNLAKDKGFRNMLDSGAISLVKEGDKIVDVVVNKSGLGLDLKVLKPIRKGADEVIASDIRILRPYIKGGNSGVVDRIGRQLMFEKAKLKKSVEANEFMRTQKPVLDANGNPVIDAATGTPKMEVESESIAKVLGCLDGGLPEEVQTFAALRLGSRQNQPLHGWRMLGQSLDHATMYDGESKALITFGKRVDQAIRIIERKIKQKLSTWNEVISSGNNAVSDAFFRLYSSIRNKGYRIQGLYTDGYGMRAELNMRDAFTFKQYCKQTGISEEVVSSLLKGELPDGFDIGRNRTIKAVTETLEKGGTRTSYKFFVPAMDNTAVSAIITDQTAMKLMQEWADVQENLYGVLQHSERIADSGKTYTPYHLQVADESIEDMWFLYGRKRIGRDEYGNARWSEYEHLGSYRSDADITKDAVRFAKQGWSLDSGRGPGNIKGLSARQKEALRNRVVTGYETGRAQGVWQGNLYDTGYEALAEIYQRTMEEGRFAIRQNARAAMRNVMGVVESSLNDINRSDRLFQDYQKLIVGQIPEGLKNLKGESSNINDMVRDVIDNTWRSIRRWMDKPDVLSDNIWTAAPIELRSKGKAFIANLSKDISLAMYSGFNASAAVTNVLSILQATPMAMQWYNKFPNETVDEWLLRTGIKLADGKVHQVSDTALGLSFLDKLCNKEGRAEIFKLAEEAGVMTNELKSLRNVMDPLYDAPRKGFLGMVKKAVRKTEGALEWGSGLTFASEEWSRLAAFGVGYEVATKRFKMTKELAKQWAAGFVEVAQGGYSMFSRPGYSNNMLAKHFFMFTSYMNNFLTRNLDMYFGGDTLGAIKSNVLSAALFGLKTTPFAKQWLAAHYGAQDYDLSTMADLGLSSLTGLAFTSMSEFDVASMTRGVTRPLVLSAVTDLALLIEDVKKDIAMANGEGVSMQYVMESASVHLPVVAGRRLLQAMLGYKVTMNHNILVDLKEDIHDQIMQDARLLAGLSTTQDRHFANWDRYLRELEKRKQEGAQQAKRSLLTRTRNGPQGAEISADDKELDAILENVIRFNGYDAQAVTQKMMQVLQDADASLSERLFNKLVNSNKYDPVLLLFLDTLSQFEE